MAVQFHRPHALIDTPTHYCPGCPHGIVHRLVAESIDELGVEGKTVGIAPVGCSVTAYNYFNCDMIQAPHGRAPAVATGVKRALPDSLVFSYQGDGDLIAIGIVFQLLQSGVRVPEDVEVIGFDNIELASVIAPPLSTISKPHYDMAWHISDQLLKVIAGEPVPLSHTVVEPQLVLRATTRQRD